MPCELSARVANAAFESEARPRRGAQARGLYLGLDRRAARRRRQIKALAIELKYGPNGERVIRHIRRVSKPGRRVYSPADRLRPVLNGLEFPLSARAAA